MRSVRSTLGDGGLFLIFEPANLEGETRAAYLERYEQFIESDWTALSPAERNILWTHVRTCDFPEQPSTWLQLGHDAGFTEVTDLFTDAPKFSKVISYRP
jgi:hypothetical protein